MPEPSDQPTPPSGHEVTGSPRHRRAHTSARDLERYAGLFASRTRVMRSSAMRDLMEITARPEVISLAGGLPDTTTFPPESFAAQMTRIAQESSAEALQYGPTEGFERTKSCIAEVMAAEGMRPDPEDIIVTTGGQQAIDLLCRVMLDAGDPILAEGPTYPGAVQWLVQLTPLYHGVALERGLMLGEVGPGLLVHVLYLAVLGLVGFVGTARRIERLLLS